MYKTILLTLDGTPTDRAIIEHIKQLAKLTQGRVVLLHVADGWAARTFGPDAVSPEITEDTAYLEQGSRRNFNPPAFPPRRNWLTANRAKEIVKWVEKKGCDLVAMSTHGHGFLGRSVSGQRVPARPAQHQRARAPAPGKRMNFATILRQLEIRRAVRRSAANFPRHPRKTKPCRRPPPDGFLP